MNPDPSVRPAGESQRYRIARRTDPLPPSVWIVACDNVYQALRVTAPGAVDLWDGGRRPPRPVGLVAARPGWWRHWRLRLIDHEGRTTVVRVLGRGEQGMADVGRDCAAAESNTFADADPLGLVLAFLALPWAIAARRRRNRAARELRDALGLT